MKYAYVRISDLVLPVSNWNPSASATEDFVYVDISSVDTSNKSITQAKRIPCSSAPSRARQLLKSADVLVSTVRPNLNCVAHVSAEFEGATASTGFCVLRPDEETLDSRYLFHWVQSKAFIGDMVSKATGASYPAVSDAIIHASEIPLPPLEEQRRIAAILDASQKLQRLHRQRVEGLFGLRQSMYRRLFGLPGSELLPLSSLARITSGYAFKAADFCRQGLHIIRMSDLNGEDVDLASSALVPAEVVEGLERFELFEGDILLGMSGSLGKLGIVPCIPAGTRAFLNQRVAKISLLPNTPISRELLVESIKSREYIAHLERCAAGVAVRNVSAAQMLSFAIPIPSPENARRFSEACNGVSAQIAKSEHCITQSKELQASLVEAFIGKP